MPPSGRQTPPPEAPMNIITEPRVYLVGRQNVDRSQVDRFLDEYGMSWETDTEVGGEQLAEAGGRPCSLSVREGRKTNAEYIGNIIGQKHGSVLEHAVWNFIIAGVSRSFTHELIRHRAGWGATPASLRHFIGLGGAEWAEAEIRKVARELLRIMRDEAPNLFSDYEVVRLDDGTEIARTQFEKV